MSFGKRRPKLSRAHLRPCNPIAHQQGRLARQRDRLARLAVIAVTVIATSAIVHGSGPPFTFRLGQRPGREIRVNVDEFKRRNLKKTNSARQIVGDQVAPTMVNDPAPIRDLAERLDDLTVAIAKAPRLDALPESLRTTWNLTSEAYDEIKAATDTPERRDALHRQIAQAFAPLIRDGILGYDTLPSNEEASRTLAVHAVGQPPEQARPVPRERVVPERVTKPEGPIFQEFISAFPTPTVGPALFRLVAEKLKGTATLTYEEQYTNRQRELARSRVKDVYDTYRRGDVLVEQDQKIEDEPLILLRMEHKAANAALGLGARARRAGSVVILVAALFALIGYYVQRHEPQIASGLRRIAALCGLVVLTIGLVRLLAVQPWDAELIPVAIAAMILAIAYNPHFALMVTFGLCLLTSLALGTGIDHFLVLMGGTAAGVLTLHEVRTRTKLIKVGATAALGYFVLTWATGLWQDAAAGPDRRRQPLARRLGPDGRVLPRRQPAVRRELVRNRHRDQPAGAGRYHSPVAAGAGPARPGDAQPLDHRRRRSPRAPPSGSAPMPCSSASVPISTTSARCSSPITSSRIRRERPTGTPTWRRR